MEINAFARIFEAKINIYDIERPFNQPTVVNPINILIPHYEINLLYTFTENFEKIDKKGARHYNLLVKKSDITNNPVVNLLENNKIIKMITI